MTGTPAEKSANSGTASPAETGRTRCSIRSPGDSFSPSRWWHRSIRPIATPAMVACTPLACISPQLATASGT